MVDGPPRKGSSGPQMLGSLAGAVVIVAAAIWAVTARLGPTSIAEMEAGAERAEEAREAAEETGEEAREAEEEKARDSGGRRRGRDR